MRTLSLLALLTLCSLHARASVEPATPAASADSMREIQLSTETGRLRIGVVGLVHAHVEGLLWQSTQRPDLKIVGIYDPDRALFDRLAAKYNLDSPLYHASLNEMLDASKP